MSILIADVLNLCSSTWIFENEVPERATPTHPLFHLNREKRMSILIADVLNLCTSTWIFKNEVPVRATPTHPLFRLNREKRMSILNTNVLNLCSSTCISENEVPVLTGLDSFGTSYARMNYAGKCWVCVQLRGVCLIHLFL